MLIGSSHLGMFNSNTGVLAVASAGGSAFTIDGVNYASGSLSSTYSGGFLIPTISGFCAVTGGNPYLTATTSDGFNWATHSQAINFSPTFNVWDGTVICGVTLNNTTSATSPDGITTTLHTSCGLPSQAILGIAANSTKIGVITYNGVATISAYVSTDHGVTFSLASTLPAAHTWTGQFIWDGAVFAITSTDGHITTSPDLVTWTTISMPSNQNFQSLMSNGKLMCAVVYSGTDSATSPDHGATWTQHNSTIPVSENWGNMVWSGSYFFLQGLSSNVMITSATGLGNWTQNTMPTVSGGYNGHIATNFLQFGTY